MESFLFFFFLPSFSTGPSVSEFWIWNIAVCCFEPCLGLRYAFCACACACFERALYALFLQISFFCYFVFILKRPR